MKASTFWRVMFWLLFAAAHVVVVFTFIAAFKLWGHTQNEALMREFLLYAASAALLGWCSDFCLKTRRKALIHEMENERDLA